MHITRVVVVIFLISAAFFLAFHELFETWFANERGIEWLREKGAWGGLAGSGLIASDLLLPIPGIGLSAALGQVYGAWAGGLYALLGNLAGGVIAYGSVRILGPGAARWMVGEEGIRRLSRFFEKTGAWSIAVTRVLPVFPEILCCLAGLAPMRFGRFFIALLCGSAPVSFLAASFGEWTTTEPLMTILVASAVPALLFPVGLWALGRVDAQASRD